MSNLEAERQKYRDDPVAFTRHVLTEIPADWERFKPMDWLAEGVEPIPVHWFPGEQE